MRRSLTRWNILKEYNFDPPSGSRMALAQRLQPSEMRQIPTQCIA